MKDFQASIVSELSKTADKLNQGLSLKADSDSVLKSMSQIKVDSASNSSDLLKQLRTEVKAQDPTPRIEQALRKLEDEMNRLKDYFRGLSEQSRSETQ